VSRVYEEIGDEKVAERNAVNKILVLDLETTDLKPAIGDILEIGAVLLSSDGTIEKAVDEIIKPTKPVEMWCDCWCLRNTDLTLAAVLAGQTLDEVRDFLQGLLQCYSVTSYNRDFDIDYLTYNGFAVRRRIACPMLIASDIMKLQGSYNNYRWPKFQAAWDYFFPDSSYKARHGAFDDAWHVARLVHKLKELGYYRGVL